MITKSQNLSVAQLKAVGVVTHYEMEKEKDRRKVQFSSISNPHFGETFLNCLYVATRVCPVKQKVKNIFNNATDMTVHRLVIKRLNCLAESTLAIMTVINTTLGGVA